MTDNKTFENVARFKYLGSKILHCSCIQENSEVRAEPGKMLTIHYFPS
jgi:hypothetical protein